MARSVSVTKAIGPMFAGMTGQAESPRLLYGVARDGRLAGQLAAVGEVEGVPRDLCPHPGTHGDRPCHKEPESHAVDTAVVRPGRQGCVNVHMYAEVPAQLSYAARHGRDGA